MLPQEKLAYLKRRLKNLKSALIAYSGGVDSTFLLKTAKETLGDKILAVTAVSETYPVRELIEARNSASRLKVPLKVIRTRELRDPRFRNNPVNRCYYCKKELFRRLRDIADRHKLNFVIDGSNLDDMSDYRPGGRAKKEFGVVSPLQEAGLTKEEIRRLSKKAGLMTWRKPALACLASRIPYNSQISKERLKRIDRAEELLRKRFRIKGNLRVRDSRDLACIEVDKEEIRILAASNRLQSLLKPLGYKNAALDLDGYRTGSLNEGLKKK